jgi:hypothetical protein
MAGRRRFPELKPHWLAMNAVFWRYDFAGLGSDAPAGEYDDFIRQALYGLDNGRSPEDVTARIRETLSRDGGVLMQDSEAAQLGFDIRNAWESAEFGTLPS